MFRAKGALKVHQTTKIVKDHHRAIVWNSRSVIQNSNGLKNRIRQVSKRRIVSKSIFKPRFSIFDLVHVDLTLYEDSKTHSIFLIFDENGQKQGFMSDFHIFE